MSSLKARPRGASHPASRLDLFGLLTAVTQRDKIVCVSYQNGAALHRLAGVRAGEVVRTPAASSIPCRATFMSNGTDHAALGAPSSVGANRPSSITPAFSHRATSPRAGNVPS